MHEKKIREKNVCSKKNPLTKMVHKKFAKKNN